MIRMALTGIGLVCPLGATAAAVEQAWREGKAAASAPLAELSGTPLASRTAAATPEVDVAGRLGSRGRKLMKYMSPAAQLLCAAAREAMEQAKPHDRHPAERLGLYAAIGLANADADETRALVAASLDHTGAVSCRLLGERGLPAANPLLSFRILPNMPACLVSILEQLGGDNALFTAGHREGVDPLHPAWEALTRGVVDGVCVAAVDLGATAAVFAHHARMEPDDGAAPATAAVALFLERAETAGARALAVAGHPGDWSARVAGEEVRRRLGETFAAREVLRIALGALTVWGDATANGTNHAPAVRCPSRPEGVRVAVTGFGVVSPLGMGSDDFFRALAEGRPGIAAITRFDASTLAARLAGEVPDEAVQRARAAAAGLMARLDASAAGRDGRLAMGLPRRLSDLLDDEKAVFGLAAALEALGQAGRDADRIAGERPLVALGASLERFFPERVVADGKVDFPAVLSRAVDGDGGWLQYPLDWTARFLGAWLGAASWTNVSACAAGAQAIGQAFRAVRSGACPWALCGGFDSMVNPLGVGGFARLGALAPGLERGARACRPFDADRTGTVLGEGAALLVLEPLEAARAAGRRILAEVVGYGSSLDAYGLSAPDPEGRGAERAMRAALDDAGLRPEAVDAVNVHGTGTALNDEVEAGALRRLFPHWTRMPASATKAMTGHLIAAAGAVEAGACLAAFATGRLAPNISLDRVAAGCELDHVTGAGRPFGGDIMLSNSFGFGGQNAALLFRRV